MKPFQSKRSNGSLVHLTLGLIGGLLIIVGLLFVNHPGEVSASSSFLGLARTKYPAIAGTRLDSCSLCHTSSIPNLNPYGTAWKNAGASTTAFAAIEALDSDGDGVSNLKEIQSLTFPGDASDKPAAATATKTATAVPTLQPTATKTATALPTSQATATKTATAVPTSQATATKTATAVPTSQATATKTVLPTSASTGVPTVMPTFLNTATGIPGPGQVTATAKPTAQPTVKPTSKPHTCRFRGGDNDDFRWNHQSKNCQPIRHSDSKHYGSDD